MISYIKPKDILGLGIEPELSDEQWHVMRDKLDGVTHNQATEDLSEYEEDFKEFEKLPLTNN